MNKRKKQPLGITLNAIMWLVAGILLIILAIGVAALGALGIVVDLVPFSLALGGIAILLFIVGIAALVVAYGLWKHATWAWWIATVLLMLNIASSILAMITTGVISFNIISVILLVLLFKKDVLKAIDTGIAYKGW